MKYRFITYAICLLTLFTACSTENDVASSPASPSFPSDDLWNEEVMDGASATVKGFTVGDAVSRTSLVFNGQSLIFGWAIDDRLGLYPTAKDLTNWQPAAAKLEMMRVSEGSESVGDAGEGDASGTEGSGNQGNIPDGLLSQTEYPHPSLKDNPNIYRVDPEQSPENGFYCEKVSGQTARITNGDGDFLWDDVVRWSAYRRPLATVENESSMQDENYELHHFSFVGQTQKALPKLGEYFDYEDKKGDANAHLDNYQQSETSACEHLGEFDVLISPETEWVEGKKIHFQMRHIGAVARIYLKVAEENLTIKDVKLICDSKIFYEKGSFTLFSHPYIDDESKNYGVDLNNRNSSGCQIKPEGAPVNKLQLNFTNTCVTKKTGSGNYGPYVVAYLMMYPITYKQTDHGNLFAYVTATKANGEEVHYVSEALANKTMESGKYYQWTSATRSDDGLYPIELTATLKPWQEIVGASIDLDLEK